MNQTQQTEHQLTRRSRPVEIRYSTEYFTNALYDRYNTREEAVIAKHELVDRLRKHNFPKVAGSVEIN